MLCSFSLYLPLFSYQLWGAIRYSAGPCSLVLLSQTCSYIFCLIAVVLLSVLPLGPDVECTLWMLLLAALQTKGSHIHLESHECPKFRVASRLRLNKRHPLKTDYSSEVNSIKKCRQQPRMANDTTDTRTGKRGCDYFYRKLLVRDIRKCQCKKPIGHCLTHCSTLIMYRFPKHVW